MIENIHEVFFKKLISAAKKYGEPFFSIIVDRATNEILSEGVNKTNKGEPLLHSEIVAMQNLTLTHPGIDRSKLIIYSTAEPCPMCAAAMVYGHLHNVVFGISREKLFELGWREFNITASDILKNAKQCNGYAFSVSQPKEDLMLRCVKLFKDYKEQHPQEFDRKLLLDKQSSIENCTITLSTKAKF